MKWQTEILVPGVLLVGTFSGLLPAGRNTWSTRDWHQWSDKDCLQVLTDSPWAKTLGQPQVEPSLVRQERVSCTVQLISALPIRQALARQWQIGNHYDQMNPEHRRSADQRINEEIGQSYEDRIVVRVVTQLVDVAHPTKKEVVRYAPMSPSLIFPHSKNIEPHQTTDYQMNSHFQVFRDSTFARNRGGRPLVEPNDKKFTIELLAPERFDFVFDLKKMVYAGKLEY